MSNIVKSRPRPKAKINSEEAPISEINCEECEANDQCCFVYFYNLYCRRYWSCSCCDNKDKKKKQKPKRHGVNNYTSSNTFDDDLDVTTEFVGDENNVIETGPYNVYGLSVPNEYVRPSDYSIIFEGLEDHPRGLSSGTGHSRDGYNFKGQSDKGRSEGIGYSEGEVTRNLQVRGYHDNEDHCRPEDYFEEHRDGDILSGATGGHFRSESEFVRTTEKGLFSTHKSEKDHSGDRSDLWESNSGSQSHCSIVRENPPKSENEFCEFGGPSDGILHLRVHHEHSGGGNDFWGPSDNVHGLSVPNECARSSDYSVVFEGLENQLRGHNGGIDHSVGGSDLWGPTDSVRHSRGNNGGIDHSKGVSDLWGPSDRDGYRHVVRDQYEGRDNFGGRFEGGGFSVASEGYHGGHSEIRGNSSNYDDGGRHSNLKSVVEDTGGDSRSGDTGGDCGGDTGGYSGSGDTGGDCGGDTGGYSGSGDTGGDCGGDTGGYSGGGDTGGGDTGGDSGGGGYD